MHDNHSTKLESLRQNIYLWSFYSSSYILGHFITCQFLIFAEKHRFFFQGFVASKLKKKKSSSGCKIFRVNLALDRDEPVKTHPLSVWLIALCNYLVIYFRAARRKLLEPGSLCLLREWIQYVRYLCARANILFHCAPVKPVWEMSADVCRVAEVPGRTPGRTVAVGAQVRGKNRMRFSLF